MTSKKLGTYDYDVAISYASEDRKHAEALAGVLKKHDVKVFFAPDKQADLWGKNLIDVLSDIYKNRARYCIIFLSEHYIVKKWPKLERQVAQDRALEGLKEYILPISLDKSKAPDFLSTIASIPWQENTVEAIADMVVKKLPSTDQEEPKWFREFRKGCECFKRREFEEALEAYEQAIAIEPDSVIYNNRGVALYHLRRYDAALEAFQRATLPWSEYTDLYHKKALLWALQCDINFLVVYSNAVAYNNRGRTLYRLNRYDEALTACAYAIQCDPDFAAAYDTRGRIFNRQARYEQALHECEKAIQLDPRLAEAYDDKGWALYGLKCYQDSLAACKDAIWLDPQLAVAYNNKGRALNELERYEEALEAYNKAIELDGNDAKVFYNKGETLRHIARTKEPPTLLKEALNAYEQAIELDGSYAAAYHRKWQILYSLKSYDKARKALDQAIQLYHHALRSSSDTDLNSIIAIAYKDKGQTLSKLKRRSEALKAFEQAIQFNPALPDAYTGKGHALEALGQHGEAQRAFAMAHQLRQNGN